MEQSHGEVFQEAYTSHSRDYTTRFQYSSAICSR
jgi:hypothetical protein